MKNVRGLYLYLRMRPRKHVGREGLARARFRDKHFVTEVITVLATKAHLFHSVTQDTTPSV